MVDVLSNLNSTSLNSDAARPDEATLPVDQTAQEIAEILGIDLSSCGNSDQGTEIIVDSVYQLIAQFQACTQQNAELQQMVQDMQEQLDELSGDEEEEELPPDAAGGDQAANTYVPNQNPNEDQVVDPSLQDTANPKQRPPQNIPPQQQKKVVAPSKKKPIAASFGAVNSQAGKMLVENRNMKIERLAREGIITPEIATDLRRTYTSSDAIALSLSNDSAVDNKQFDLMLSMFERNSAVIGKAVVYGESDMYELGSSPHALQLAHIEQSEKKPSPLVADAERRTKEASN